MSKFTKSTELAIVCNCHTKCELNWIGTSWEYTSFSLTFPALLRPWKKDTQAIKQLGKTGSHHAKFKAVAVTGVEKTPMLINNDHYTDLNKPKHTQTHIQTTKDQPLHKTCQAKHAFQRNCTQVIPKTAELHVIVMISIWNTKILDYWFEDSETCSERSRVVRQLASVKTVNICTRKDESVHDRDF